MGNSYFRVASLALQGLRRTESAVDEKNPPVTDWLNLNFNRHRRILQEELFHSMLTPEYRRAERSSNLFVLMLVSIQREDAESIDLMEPILEIISRSARETDLFGWHKRDTILGVIFTEVSATADIFRLRSKFVAALQRDLGRQKAQEIMISLHISPKDLVREDLALPSHSKVHPDFDFQMQRKREALILDAQ